MISNTQQNGFDPFIVASHESIYFDTVLYKQDIFKQHSLRTRKLHVWHLAEARFAKIESSLKQAEQEWNHDAFKVVLSAKKYVDTLQ